MSFAVTANLLDDGRVVFRTTDGGWSPQIADAVLAGSEEEAGPALAAAQADAANDIVIEPYLIHMDATGASPRPSKLRELIRAFGPTIAYAPAALLEAAE